jgi:bifunctional DNA-binding transcriptional regulator/antitoxin component of YhaV-PrlF toxin-antitoxin module
MVTFNGRITLPFPVLKQLGLKTGDNVDFVEIEKGRFAINASSESMKALGRAQVHSDINEASLDTGSAENFAGREDSA